MVKNLDAAQRLFDDDGKPEHVALASKDWPITSHDPDEHRATVIERRRQHIRRLEALLRELGVLKTVAKNADVSGRALAAHCLFSSVVLHDIERREKELEGLIKMHERNLAMLGGQP